MAQRGKRYKKIKQKWVFILAIIAMQQIFPTFSDKTTAFTVLTDKYVRNSEGLHHV